MKKLIIATLFSLLGCFSALAEPVSSLSGNDVNIDADKNVSICAGTGDVRVATDCSGGGTQTTWKFSNANGQFEGAKFLGTAGIFGNTTGETSLDSDITGDAGTSIKLYVQGNSASADEMALVDTGADAGGFNVNVYKTRATSANANTIVASGDTAYSTTVKGANGTSYTNGARMSAIVSATPGAADMPMDWVLYNTPDGTASLAETLRITSEGVVKAAKGNVEMSTGGTTIAIQEGTAASACMGTATGNGATGTVVSTTCAKTASRIFISRTSAPSGTAQCWADTIVNNTSFVLDCTGAETGTFNWMIVQEAS